MSLQCQKIEIKKLPFLASDITNFTSAVCAVVMEMSSVGEPLFETWANSYSADLYSSYTTVYNNSAEWGSADSSVNSFVYNTSANILNVNSAVNTHSANWDSVYSSFNSVSGDLLTFQDGDSRYVKLSGDVMFGGLSSPSISADTLYVGNSTINFFDENYQVVETLKGTDVTKFKSNYNTVNTKSANWEEAYTTVETNSGDWNYQGNDIKALTANWESSYTTVNSNSSTTWNYQGTDIKSLTSNWQDSYTALTSTSGDWNDTRTIVRNNSATLWNYQGTDIKALTSNWQNTYNIVSSSSANWNNVYSVVQTNSSQWAVDTSIDTGVRALTSNWENTYNTVNSNSANWNYQGTDIKSLTSNWENTYVGFSTQSANNISVYSSFNSQSANNSSVYSIVNSNSGNWNYQGTDIKVLTSNWENTFSNFSAQSANNLSVYNQVYSQSANWVNPVPQTLSFNEITAELSISNGNSVSLSSLSGGNSTATGNYLPLSGGTLTGNLNIQASISSVNSIQFNTATAVTVGAGQMAWNSAESTVDVGISDNVTLQLGQEVLVQVKNSSGEIIYNGSPVYAIGASGGGSGNITVSAYKAGVNDPDELYFLGVATEQLNVNDFGFVTTFGKVRDVRLSEVRESTDVSAWPIGTILYPSATERGKLTSVPPNAPNKDLSIVMVISVNGSNRGFFVRAEHGYHLNEIHDVALSNPSNAQVLSYNSASGVWINSSETDPVFTTWAQTYSGNYDSVYSTVQSNSSTTWNYQGTDVKILTANWENTYSTVQANSAQWAVDSTIDVGVRSLTSNWENTYTNFSVQSANNTSVYNTVQSNSSTNWNYQGNDIKALTANWDSVYTNVNSNSANAFVKASIGITIDGGGSAITTGSKGFISIPYSCTITDNTLVADQSGSIVIDVKKATYAGFPSTTSICAAAKPTLASVQKNTDSTLTGWTTTINAGDIIEFYVDSATTVTRVTLTLGVNKFT